MRQGKEDWAETCFVRVLYPQDGYDVDAVRKNFTQSPQMVAVCHVIRTSCASHSGSRHSRRSSVRLPKRGLTSPLTRIIRPLASDARSTFEEVQSARVLLRRCPWRRLSLAALRTLLVRCVSPPSHGTLVVTSPQLHFALTDAKDWTTVYDGFNYAFFYDFIVDFFEGPQKTESRRQNVEDILDWWNEYVLVVQVHIAPIIDVLFRQIFPRGHCRARRGGDMISKSAALLDEQD